MYRVSLYTHKKYDCFMNKVSNIEKKSLTNYKTLEEKAVIPTMDHVDIFFPNFASFSVNEIFRINLNKTTVHFLVKEQITYCKTNPFVSNLILRTLRWALYRDIKLRAKHLSLVMICRHFLEKRENKILRKNTKSH